jgi:hypothetical protein
MNRPCRLPAATVGLALVLGACGTDEPESASTPDAQDTTTAAPSEDGGADGGTGEEDAHADHGGDHLAEPTPVTINGLDPQFTYPSHMHDGACSDPGGHYQQDPAGPMSPPNETWGSSSDDPSGNLVPNRQGTAVGRGSADWVPRAQELAVQIHEPELPGFPVVCADFSAYDSAVTIVLTADASHGADIDAIEYSLDGSEMVAYEGPVEVVEPGSHVLLVQGVDPNGTATDPQEVTFAVDDAA